MEISLSQIVVKVGRPERTLFRIPDLKIRSGEKILLKGASGAGKTTFLHLLAGLLTPHEGELSMGESKFNRLSEAERGSFRRQNLGLVFQKLNLIDHLTALENIELSLRSKDLAPALTALKAVGLEGRENDRVGVLSLGEQQRVAVARVMAGTPKIVLADEPTSSLDEKNAQEIADLLVRSCEGKTLIAVSHDGRIEKYFSKVIQFSEFTR